LKLYTCVINKIKMITVTCAIILNNDKILVAQRSERMKLPLKWEFPGGKLELGESEVDCVIREVREELGIEIEIIERLPNCIHDYGSFVINLIPFISKYQSGNILLKEHASFKWLTKDELITIDWAEADLPVVLELLNKEL
jgi:8-oxo-dGTP diphosphatase